MRPTLLKRFFPFLRWARPTRDTLREDLFAGITVALLAIPQSLAYAQLAGVPAHYGLYAALIPSMVGVLFGSSALLSTGPVALTSLLTAASVRQIAPAGTEEFATAVMLLALMSGVFQIALGMARAGVLLNLLSHPVLTGFINAAAVVIALSQLPALTGISVPQAGGVLLDTWHLLGHVGDVHSWTLAVGTLAIALLIAFRRFAPRQPGVLIMAVLLTLLSLVTGFADRGGAIVGNIPVGLPALSVPAVKWSAVAALLPAAFVITLVSFMEAMSSCKVIALKTRTRWDENQELIGQGLAKVAAAFFHSMPVSGSFSRSALNLASRAHSGFSSLFSCIFVLLTLVAFTPLLHHLPKPALAAIIVMALYNLIDVPSLRNAWRAGTDDGIAATLTFVATLAFAPNIQNGILAGIIFSLGAFIYRRMLPQFAVHLLRDGVLSTSGPSDLPHVDETVGVLRFDAALFFANASFFEDAVLELQRENAGLKYIVVLAGGINLLDASGVEVLRSVVRHLRESGITLIVSSAKDRFLDVARRTGLTEEIGAANFFDRDDLAFARVREPPTTSPPPH